MLVSPIVKGMTAMLFIVSPLQNTMPLLTLQVDTRTIVELSMA